VSIQVLPLDIHVPQLMISHRDIMEDREQSWEELFMALFAEHASGSGRLPLRYTGEDILLVQTIELQPEYRGYGIGLFALDSLMKRVARARPAWGEGGLTVLEPSPKREVLLDEKGDALEVDPDEVEQVQEKLIRNYQLLGLEVFSRATMRHCTIVGTWMGQERPHIGTIVPHLFTPDQ
jgi:GNAT superfamily N-acetyltransferase